MEPTPALNPEIEDIYFILNSHANEIAKMLHAMYETAEQYGVPKPGDPLTKETILVHTASRMMLIMVCSFEDEFHDQSNYLIGSNIERDRLIKIKKIAKPALDGIRSFSGLRDYRSKLLAHNTRIGREGNRNAFRGNFISNLNIPTTLPDLRFVMNCVHHCREVFNAVFPEYKRLPSEFIAEHTEINVPPGMTTEECEARMTVIIKEVITIGKAEGVEFKKGE